MAKKITKYQAGDGTEFNTEAEADHHDRECEIRECFRVCFTVPADQSLWDFTGAYPSDRDPTDLRISISNMHDFLTNNMERIREVYAIACPPLTSAKTDNRWLP